eukprot:UN14469
MWYIQSTRIILSKTHNTFVGNYPTTPFTLNRLHWSEFDGQPFLFWNFWIPFTIVFIFD